MNGAGSNRRTIHIEQKHIVFGYVAPDRFIIVII
jgi:hypothetical protein